MTGRVSVLVLGAGGMAGHVVATYLGERGYDVSTLSARTRLNDGTVLLDVNDHSRVRAFFENHQFDVVVNAVGLLVKQSDERPDMAVLVNAYFPRLLEHHFSNTCTKVIHISTDCVFSGKNAPYEEECHPDGPLYYDRSKALGEINNQKDLTFRMSIVGPDLRRDGIGLFNWFANQKGEVHGYTGAMWNGVTTIELARAIDAAIVQDLSGLYHLVSSDSISKYELLQMFRGGFCRTDVSITPVQGVSLDKSLVNTRKDFHFVVEKYPVMIGSMRGWVFDHPELYPHYAHLTGQGIESGPRSVEGRG